MLRGSLPAVLSAKNALGDTRTIESYPRFLAAFFIRASSAHRRSIEMASFETTRPNSVVSIVASSPISGRDILTFCGSSRGRPQNSASAKLDARNFPRFTYAAGSRGGTCHQSFRFTCLMILSNTGGGRPIAFIVIFSNEIVP